MHIKTLQVSGSKRIFWASIVLHISLLLLGKPAFPQSDQYKFIHSSLPIAGLNFQMPAGYKEMGPGKPIRYNPQRGKLFNSPLYIIGDDTKTEVVVGLLAIALPRKEPKYDDLTLKLFKKLNPGNSDSTTFTRVNMAMSKNVSFEIDSSYRQNIFPVTEAQKEIINTDSVVIFQMKIDPDVQPFLEKYHRCRYVIMQENYRGLGGALFFYNEGDEKIVEEEIARTWGMLRFKNERSKHARDSSPAGL